MAIEPRREAALLIVFLPPSGERDEQHGGVLVRRSDGARHFVSVHVGHADVQQHGIGTERGQPDERLTSAVHGADRRPDRTQKLAEGLRGVEVVVDHEDPASGELPRRREFVLTVRSLGHREFDDELAAKPEALAARFHAPAVHGDQGPDQRQPDAEAPERDGSSDPAA